MDYLPETITIEQAQDIVEAWAPGPYFRNAYRAWESRYLPHISDLIAPLDPGKVLDIGPGWGTMAVWLSSRGWDVSVLDIANQGKFITSEFCDELPITYLQANIELASAMTRIAETYDLVLMTQVLTHLKWRPYGALRNITQLSRGKVIVSVTDAEQYNYGEVPFHNWRDVPNLASGTAPLSNETICTYTEASLRDLLQTAFSHIRISKPEESQTMIAECSNKENNDGI